MLCVQKQDCIKVCHTSRQVLREISWGLTTPLIFYFIFVCLFIRGCVCVYLHARACAHVCVYVYLVSSSTTVCLFFWGRASSWIWKQTSPRNPPVSISEVGLQVCALDTQIVIYLWNPNFSPHDYTANALSCWAIPPVPWPRFKILVIVHSEMFCYSPPPSVKWPHVMGHILRSWGLQFT